MYDIYVTIDKTHLRVRTQAENARDHEWPFQREIH